MPACTPAVAASRREASLPCRLCWQPTQGFPLLLFLAVCSSLAGPRGATVQVDSGVAQMGEQDLDGDERELQATASATPKMVGQAHAQEHVPALDLAYLRPPVTSRDVNRPACELPAGSGKFTGVCTETVHEASEMITFCGDLVRYRSCVPAHQVMWPNWNATAKDLLLQDLFKDMVEKRIAREMNVTPELYVPIHYMSNPNCVHALRNALCWYNFPKCNDDNMSLPLCSSSCNEYFTNCKYVPEAVAVAPACQSGAIASDGLFKSGVKPGPDQVLAEDRTGPGETCERVATDVEMGITVEAKPPLWYTTWWGISLLTLVGLIVIAVISYILIAPVLMDYLIVAGKRVFWFPYKFWQSLPTASGKKVIVLVSFIFLILLLVGIYRMMVNGFKRWDEWKNPWDDRQFQFKPPETIWGTQATKPMNNQQLKQLQLSCSCTGAAQRGLPALIVVAAVSLLPRLLPLLGPMF